ncbi:hypothetical protein ABB37_04811 [Leptomonas pyrrhocoris]|uniref:Uncharacterized protein n=1 Tax=Leptomonas pyrrhocoris TaxID=157538 RepID=A0A0M9G1T5_LEPPY|nr:hypothetical protein ABB37_04811 [Leptomonas pyrrhocoris]KPA80615.1 hypothetical protein ABB37_04811 [Leptomonas pyrrhocoris]|eukprot:XP_015659054.1 hypothetical protein ABB37_04811 [Leptomonas pyrrhocoris]
MLRRGSNTWQAVLVAVVAAMLLAVGVHAQSAVPRCDQDAMTFEAQVDTSSLGLLTYHGLNFCQTDVDASLEVVKDVASPNTVVTLDEWTFVVGINSVTPAVFTLNALCGTTVVCQAELTYVVPYVAPSSSHAESGSSSVPVSPYPTCTHAPNTVSYKPGATYQQKLPLEVTDGECVYTAQLDQPSTGTVAMTSLPLHYTFTSPSTSTGSTSFRYRVACDGEIVCQSTRTVTFDPSSTVPVIYPICSHADKNVTYTSGTASMGTFPMDLQDAACVYTATITQPPYLGNITPATAGLSYTYAAPSGVTASKSNTVGYAVQCNGATVCEDALRVTVVPAPEPIYPTCSQSNKTRNYATSSTQTDSFPLDVQDSSCAYTTAISGWPSVGLIVPDSTGLGYLYVMPNTAVVSTITHANYTVQCDGVVVCKDQLTVRVTPEVTPTYPVCSHGNKQRRYPVGATSSGSFPMDVQDASCVYATSISVGPAMGTLTPSASGLGYTYSVPITASVGAATTIGYRVACAGAIVCADTLAVVLAPASETTTSTSTAAPATSTTTSTTPAPGTLPVCSHRTAMRTYRIGELYQDTLPLDVVDTACAYSAVIADPAVGTVAILGNANPLAYVYQTQMNVLPQDTKMSYTIACDGTDVCNGAIAIRLTTDADACPNKAVGYVVKPGGFMTGTVNSGFTCESGATATSTLRSSVAGMTLNTAGAFTFQAPNTELDVRAIIFMRCDGVVTCQTEVVFVVASSTVAPPTTTTSTVAPITQCPRSFTFDVPTGQSLSGKLDPIPATSCNITTYLIANSSSDVSGRLRVNLLGQFFYTAPNAQGVDYAAVDVYCAKAFVCRTQLAFTAYTPLPSVGPTTSPLQPCANVYYYEAAPGVAVKTSLNNMPGQDRCLHGRYFTVNTAPQSGALEMTPIGDFIYRPPTQEGQFQFTFTMYCLNQQYCAGTAYLLVSDQWTLSPESSPTPTGTVGPVVITNEQITCQGTCNANAWKTYPTPRVWDNTPGTGYARKDGRPVDGISVTWRNNSLVFLVYSLIGNLGVRFPTFEALTSTKGAFMESQDFVSGVAAGSPGFEMSCLDNQGRAGLGEDVWKWMSLSYGAGTGYVGAYYRAGSSWYQKFGGKHIGCDTFADPCRYAPLLTPANYTNTSLGRWSIDVNDCDATWTGVFPYTSLEKMMKHDGAPVWTFVADRQVQGTLYSEAVQASSWLAPGSFETHYDTHDILISLNQFVAVTKTGTQESLVSVDAEFFTYVDAATGDEAFGINMLVYPFVDDTMASSYARDRHVVGFKWVEQEWMSPDAEQCPTCTGTKMKCTVPLEGTDATYKGAFPEGDCGNGQGRVHLVKGPAMSVDDCAVNQMHVYNRSGFSATRNCKATYQNVTLRGIVPGSRNLAAVLKRAFNYEGVIQLMLQMENGGLERLNMHLSMYVSRLSKDAQRVEGGLNTCRSGSYWPVLDPLGTSTPAHPFGLSVSEATPLCIDDLSSSYGPSDWALFTMNMPGVKPSEVTVGSVYVLLNNTRVYLVYKDPATGVAAIPDAANGAWWQYKYPFFAFRDLSAHVLNHSITFSPQMANSAAAADIVYAFTFIPGSLGLDTDIEVVVEAVIQQAGVPASSTELRRVLHVDPLLTQLSRQGPVAKPSTPSRDNARRDLYAIGATAGVAVALVVTVIFFMLADNNRPLPKWVPRGKLIKDTVLSMLPAGIRGKKKLKRTVHKDMYDAMNSGRY